MKAVSGFAMLTVALALAVGLSTAAVSRADDVKAVGTITGRVVDADGKPVKGARVGALPPGERPLGGAHAGGAAGGGAGGGGAAGDHPKMPEPLAKTESGDDGTFKLEGVPAGKVRVVAGLKGTGIGMTQAEVTAGQETKVGDIKLEKRGPDGGPGGHKAPNGGTTNQN